MFYLLTPIGRGEDERGLCPKELEMSGPKISIDCLSVPRRDEIARLHGISPGGQETWLEYSKQLSKTNTQHLSMVVTACTNVILALGECGLYVEVIKIISHLHDAGKNSDEGTGFEVQAILRGGGEKLSLCPSLWLSLSHSEETEKNEPALKEFTQSLYSGIRGLVQRRIESANQLREVWEALLPAEMSAD